MTKELTRIITLKLTLIGKYNDEIQEPVSKKELAYDILEKTGADNIEIIKIQDFERDVEVKDDDDE